MTSCKECKSETDELALFPGGICLECYKLTPEAKAPLSAEDVARMWGAKIAEPGDFFPTVSLADLAAAGAIATACPHECHDTAPYPTECCQDCPSA